MSGKHIFIIGPGGVGKTTSGEVLARLFGMPFVDLDQVFMTRVSHIGSYIREYGYEKYCYKNSEILSLLLREKLDRSVFALSSGFVVHEGLGALVEKHRNILKENGTTVVLLPSESLEESVDIIVRRQLTRGLGYKEEKERIKFRNRYKIYQKEGDIQIYSIASPEEIAREMMSKLILSDQ